MAMREVRATMQLVPTKRQHKKHIVDLVENDSLCWCKPNVQDEGEQVIFLHHSDKSGSANELGIIKIRTDSDGTTVERIVRGVRAGLKPHNAEMEKRRAEGKRLGEELNPT